MEAKESVEAMEQRHKQELKDLEFKTRAMLKAAKKSEKNVVQAEIIQMQFDLKRKQEEEYDLMIEMGGLSLSEDRREPVDDEIRSSSCDANNKPDPDELKRLEDEAIAAKKAKAQKKKDKKVTKEEQRQLVKEDIQANAGPSLREMEIARITSVLSKQNLCIKEIASDGHCLYRSIADQLDSSWLVDIKTSHSDKKHDFISLRTLAATYLRANAEDFAPFLGLLPDDSEYQLYCDKVASVAGAEWGGQLEIRALCFALHRKITIYSADSPVLTMGDDTDSDATLPSLQVAYHQHYYALGEHYNSVVPKEEPCTCGLTSSSSLS